LTEEDVYAGSFPSYYDSKKVKGLDILKSQWRVILEEFSNVLDNSSPIKLSSPNPPYLSNPNAWKNVYFYNFMWKYHKNCQKFPKTYEILKKVPFLTFAEITILEPHSDILPHIGETNTTMRGHLGLSIPGPLPEAGIEVNQKQRSWEEGKIVLFSDAHHHRVWNHTSKRRMVLVFDVIKEEYQNKAQWYCAQALSTLVIKGIDSKKPIIKIMPKWIQKGLHYIISSVWYIYLPIQNKISWLP
jgi:aspartyl/asparaginyl beta-hydroxylase (cupin superfamily)